MIAAPTLIVAMTRNHINALMPFERDMFGTEAWSVAGYRSELADTRTRHYLAAEGPDGALRGWAGVMVVGETAEILTVGVVPHARRAGIARALIAGLTAEAQRRGVTETFLEVRIDNAPALMLYESEGFERVGVRRGYYDGGRVDAVTMRRAAH
ncbi:MAG: ribosomal protein S18-alanine N-acetyltransferase [Jatrophihabitans sp.]